MLFSIAVILLLGLLMDWFCKKVKFPALFGMILAGIFVGPYMLDLLDNSILAISTELRRIALIIILIRAGLKLDLAELKKVGRSAILLCFLPACFEILGMIILAPKFLGLSYLEAAILGAVVGAVSPAVVVPRMIKLIDSGYGTEKGIPQMILAGASVDDVFVIVLFTTFTSLAQGTTISWTSFIKIPISIIIGALVGIAVGMCCTKLFERSHSSLAAQTIMFFSIAFILDQLESAFPVIPFAGLIAIMAVGSEIKKKDREIAVRLSGVFDQLWIPAEIFLFVLVGASVAIDSLKAAGVDSLLLIFGVLIFRMAGVYCCLVATSLTIQEKMFCMLAYTPKATVQAAIGGLPLAMGLPCGAIVLTVSVIAILITAPLGAFAIDLTYKRMLKPSKSVQRDL